MSILFNGVLQIVSLTLERWLVAGVYKAIGRHMKKAEPSLSSAPRPNLYPGFPSEDQKATWLASRAAAPQGEATQAPLVTLGLDLPDKENASQTTQEKGRWKIWAKKYEGDIYHPDQPTCST